MEMTQDLFVFLSPEVEQFLIDNDIDIEKIARDAGLEATKQMKADPAHSAAGQKEPVTILLASAAVIAALTPTLREAIRALSGRDAVVRERRLIPVEDSSGQIVRDASRAPILHWVDFAKAPTVDRDQQAIEIKGFGIHISFGGK